jgi:hypothetical protein
MALGEFITTVITAAQPYFQGGAPYDLIDLPTVKSELADQLDVANGSADKRLKLYITSCSIAAKVYCNRVFQKEALLDQVWPKRDPYPYQVTGGLRPLQLSRWPITSVPNVSGLRAPAAPALSSIVGGALPAARYFVRVSYLTAAGETTVSPESVVSVAADALLQVASPPQDTNTPPLAIGWNVYIGTASGKETLQNLAPLAIGISFPLPPSGLISGTAPPDYVTVVENNHPLAEGMDFDVDYQTGQLTRLHVLTGYPRQWPAFPISVAYSAGYAAIPADISDAVLRMVRGRYYARARDPALRSENIASAYEAQYWLAAGPGAADGNLTPDVEAILSKYRVPVVA